MTSPDNPTYREGGDATDPARRPETRGAGNHTPGGPGPRSGATPASPNADYGALIQVGWMCSPELAAELGITPLSDGYLVTLEQAADEGGIKPEFAARLVPIYRLADTSRNADYEGTAERWREFARRLVNDLCPICGEPFGENPREHVACLTLSPIGSSGTP